MTVQKKVFCDWCNEEIPSTAEGIYRALFDKDKVSNKIMAATIKPDCCGSCATAINAAVTAAIVQTTKLLERLRGPR